MMQSDTSNVTWISLDERPPPVSAPFPAPRRCWCWFRLECHDRPALGYYLGDGRVRLLGHAHVKQRELELERFTHWRPFDETALAEAESA